jgi:hypothetical protein
VLGLIVSVLLLGGVVFLVFLGRLARYVGDRPLALRAPVIFALTVVVGGLWLSAPTWLFPLFDERLCPTMNLILTVGLGVLPLLVVFVTYGNLLADLRRSVLRSAHGPAPAVRGSS